MAGFWSMVGLVIKSLITGNEATAGLGREAAQDSVAAEVPLCVYAVAKFSNADPEVVVGGQPSDRLAEMILASLQQVPQSRPVKLDQFFSPNPEVTDPVQAMREAQLSALNAGSRVDADAIFWGQQDPNSGELNIRLVSKALTSSLYDLMLPLTYSFKQPDHADVAQALRILLSAEISLQSRGGEQRLLQISRLTTYLEDFHQRINQGDLFNAVGSGVATAFAFGAFVLSETGDRTYCASALRVLEPHVRKILMSAGDAKPKEIAKVKTSKALLSKPSSQKEVAVKDVATPEVRTEKLISQVSDYSKIDAGSTAVIALYGGLVNWSQVAGLKVRSGAVATGVWKLLERRFEMSTGSSVDRALCICKLGEALVSSGKDADDAAIVEDGGVQYRRALGMINNRAHAPLYAITAYGLAESIVASAIINDIHIPDSQVVPVFKAALKVCARRDHPYIWGRTMFALATVHMTNGTVHKDTDLLELARRGFSHAYEAFVDAGAKGAARAASGGYSRTENTLSQLGHRKSVMDATGGETTDKASTS
ncbi:MAG: hypothetical protein KTR23_13370 [Rhodospirillales bacterium]|nr:hypothetical protein [Rhodospirillales bacterium]